MIDNTIIATIKNSGGWCQLYQSSSTSLLETIGGRLIWHNQELSFIEKFNLSTDSLDGYLIIFNNSQQRLKKAQWIKKILTVGGKTLDDNVLPKSLIAETVEELMQRLQSSREPLLIRLKQKSLQGHISDFSDTKFTISHTSTPTNGKDYTELSYYDMVCLEVRTKEIQRQWSGRTGG